MVRIKIQCIEPADDNSVFAALMAAYHTDMSVHELLDKLTSNDVYNHIVGLKIALEKMESMDAEAKNLLIRELEMSEDGYYLRLKEREK